MEGIFSVQTIGIRIFRRNIIRKSFYTFRFHCYVPDYTSTVQYTTVTTLIHFTNCTLYSFHPALSTSRLPYPAKEISPLSAGVVNVLTHFEGIHELLNGWSSHLLVGQVDLVGQGYLEDQEALEGPQAPDNLLVLEPRHLLAYEWLLSLAHKTFVVLLENTFPGGPGGPGGPGIFTMPLSDNNQDPMSITAVLSQLSIL